jgi:NADPH:quinone reductase-like Zn-dependent oxidoreductase
MSKNTRVIITKYGGPEVLQLIDEPKPKPRHNEVLIRVLIAGVSQGDIMIRRGILSSPLRKFPYTLGHEIVGVVREIGNHVTLVKKCQLVAALTLNGGYSEYICLDHKELVPVPEQINPEEAACLVLNYV